MKKLKENGITLVALIITIIILLILAGITIGQLTGNGIFENAKKAKESYENAQRLENDILSSYIEALNGNIPDSNSLDNVMKEAKTSGMDLNDIYERLKNNSNIQLDEYEEGDTSISGKITENGEKEDFIIDEDLNIIKGNEAKARGLKFSITWTNAKGNVEITKRSEGTGTIQYQINGTEGSWTNGDRVNNLDNGTIVYARIDYGTSQSIVQKVTVKDAIKPKTFTAKASRIVYNGFTIKGSTTDEQSGLRDYTYVVKDASGNELLKVENQTEEEYMVTGLNMETNYKAYMIAYDNVGNSRKSNELSITTTNYRDSFKAGDYVKYDTGNTDVGDNGVITCRVLYEDSSQYRLQIISDYVVDNIALGSSSGAEPGGYPAQNVDSGIEEYNNCISDLNEEAEKYINSKTAYVVDARCVGSLPTIQENLSFGNNKNSGSTTIRNLSWDDTTSSEMYDSDDNYILDCTRMTELQILDINECYFLGSRIYEISNVNWGCIENGGIVRVVYSNGEVLDTTETMLEYYEGEDSTLVVHFSNNSADIISCTTNLIGFRPVFSLNANIKITGGDGTTEETAWRLGM